ncbi:sensor domain-containing diguanylate cyclase [Shewanella gelidii]|uniref:diguanylate cyclase n=1 Tax=Shewanella gelidii TaxID=1642821 RepID=A0A917JKR0_9GAMM|nr:GGDEF domain-containing protein [Shewanella gelidii]MCL1097259.1 diguanylate cyclase [Shewanella gelidii]GGI73704.1 GGDEF domain-containing protein [Shewanella gelidii]
MKDSFHWDKHFVTGLDDVDEQHHNLVDMVNRLGHLLSDNELVFQDVVSLLNQLQDYASLHFWEEELLMHEKQVDLRHVELQKIQHREFIKEIKSLHRGLSPNDQRSAQYLLDFLTHWLAYHILGADQNMARQIEAIENGASPAEAYEAEEHESDSATEPLLKALHGLFEQVSVRNKELVELNASLERKVAERTRELVNANQDLEKMALTDVLTGLPNRRYAMAVLEDLWCKALPSGMPLSLMMIDADHFKEVNDTYGHDAGDLVLRELARTMNACGRNHDVICRLGGDEFLLICPNTDHEESQAIAENILHQVNHLKVITGEGFWQGSVSIGVASKTPETKDFERLIKLADLGVYCAKQAGKNCVRRAE